MNRNLDFFTKKYLENRPMFLATIRAPEAVLFTRYSHLLKPPTLDFGCGDGFFAQTVFEKNKITIGLDIKNQRTKEIVAKDIYKQVVFYSGKTIPFKNDYFQTIISNCVLEHVLDINLAVKEIYRILKPQSFFLTTVMTERWNKYLLGKKIFGRLYINFLQKRQAHSNLFSYDKWRRLFQNVGFKQVQCIGYLSENCSHFLELAHYLSIPSLISYKLFGNWQSIPQLNPLIWKNYISRNANLNVNVHQSSALFFCLKK